MPDTADKTLEPTPHRRQQAREQGQVARSHDLSSAVMLLAGLGALTLLGGSLAGFLVNYCRNQLGRQPALTADSQWAVAQWNAVLGSLAVRVAPILGLVCLAAVAVNVFQGGFLLLPKRAAVDLGRLSLSAGSRRVFSAASFARLAFGVLKLATISAAAGALLYREVNQILALAELAPPARGGAGGRNRPIDRVEARRCAIAAGPAGLRLPVVSRRARPENDAARVARRTAEPRRQPQSHRPPQTGPARTFSGESPRPLRGREFFDSTFGWPQSVGCVKRTMHDGRWCVSRTLQKRSRAKVLDRSEVVNSSIPRPRGPNP